MSNPEEIISSEFKLSLDERILLSNVALDIVRENNRGIEVVIPMDDVMQRSANEELMQLNAWKVSHAAFKNVGALLQGHLRADNDLRTVKLTEEREYRITPNTENQSNGQVRSARNTMNYLIGIRY